MNLLPKTEQDFSRKEYWNTFFKKRGQKAFEWYGEYPELCGLLHKYVKSKDVILIIGCGNSTLSSDLYDVGYRQITNIDISNVVIKQMQERHKKDRPEMVYKQMDATEMKFDAGQFSVVLDKGTLDALMPDDTEESKSRVDKLLQEVDRVLRIGGRYVCVSLLQEHILEKLLEFSEKANWMFRVCRCMEAEQKAEMTGEGAGFPVFVVVCTKFKKMPNCSQVLEVCLVGEILQRLQTPSDVISSVKSLQDSAMVVSRLGQGTVAGHGEIKLDLHRPGDSKPRYTIHVLDQPFTKEGSRRYAAFIVPQGRETEWLFATPEGRLALLKSAGYDRLAIVSLHRDQQYPDLYAVEDELSDSVLHLAPPGVTNHTQGNTGKICKHVDWAGIVAPSENYRAAIDSAELRKQYYFIARNEEPPKGWLEPLYSSGTVAEAGTAIVLQDVSKQTVSMETDEAVNEVTTEELKIESNSATRTEEVLDKIRDLFREFANRSPEEVTNALEVMYEKMQKIKTPSAIASHCSSFGRGYDRKNHGNYIPVQPTSVSRRKQQNLTGRKPHVGGRPRSGVIQHKKKNDHSLAKKILEHSKKLSCSPKNVCNIQQTEK